MNINTPRVRGIVQNEQVCGIVCDYKQILSDNKTRYALIPQNINTLGLLFERWGRCLFNCLIIFLNKKNNFCYRKYPLDPGIQVWLDMAYTGSNMVDIKEDLLTQISDTSYPNVQISHPDFIPCRHGWNYPGLAGSVYIPQSYIIHFT